MSASNHAPDGGFVEIKSKFAAEFRRFSLDGSKYASFDLFRSLVAAVHQLQDSSSDFHIFYVDPKDDDLLPITNTDNYLRALQSARPLLRVVIQRQGERDQELFRRTADGGVGQSLFTSMLGGPPKSHKSVLPISLPTEFRQVSAIIDVDVVPDTCRRVRLLKHGSDKPLGFYIRDGTSVRVTAHGLEKVPGIFISRLLAGGLAESTGLLAVNDEILEVNGIEVAGKTLDQVTDMMVANSTNLIVTVRPANQRATLTNQGPRRGSFSRNSNVSQASLLSRSSTQSSCGREGIGFSLNGAAANTNFSDTGDHDDEDEIRDLTRDNYSNLVSSSGSAGKTVLHL
jgi:partitioning defective protein 6